MYYTKKWDKLSPINGVPALQIIETNKIFKEHDDIWLIFQEVNGKEMVSEIELSHLFKAQLNIPQEISSEIVFKQEVLKRNINTYLEAVKSGYITIKDVPKALQEKVKELYDDYLERKAANDPFIRSLDGEQ
jgi:hypothetical protein